jgi:hypothetical protein
LKVSVSSGRPGTEVTVSGNAGPDCVVDQNWLGFDFEPRGDLTKGPETAMATPVATDGSWSATFAIPSFLGGSAARGPGAAAAAGRYQFVARACKSRQVTKATFTVTSGAPSTASQAFVGIATTLDGKGYWLVQADGSVAAHGDAVSYGSLAAAKLASGTRIVGIARTYDAHGYWLAASDGNVYTFGDAHPYGSPATGNTPLAAPVTAIAATPDGKGYWMLGANGTVYGFGDAHVIGAPKSYLAPYDAIAARPAGGYVVTAASDGAVYLYPGNLLSSFGPGSALSATLAGTAVTPSGNGTWQVGTDGGVLTSGDGDQKYFGSIPGENKVPKAPVTAIAATPDGHGYWLLSANGTVYPFGDAHSYAAAAGTS